VVQKKCTKFIASELCNCESQHNKVFTTVFINEFTTELTALCTVRRMLVMMTLRVFVCINWDLYYAVYTLQTSQMNW